MLFLLIILTYIDSKLREDHAYRIKLAGDEELYLVQISNRIRLIGNAELNKSDNFIDVVQLRQSSGGTYTIDFCGSYLATKRSDPGIVSIREKDDKYTDWEIKEDGNTYELINREWCLAKVDEMDDKSGGFYLNEQKCSKSNAQKFSILDMGHIVNYCTKDAEDICQDLLRNTDNRPQGRFSGEEDSDHRDDHRSNNRRHYDRNDYNGPRNRRPDDRGDDPQYRRSDNGPDDPQNHRHYDKNDDPRSRHGMPNGDPDRFKIKDRRFPDNEEGDSEDYLDRREPSHHGPISEHDFHHGYN